MFEYLVYCTTKTATAVTSRNPAAATASPIRNVRMRARSSRTAHRRARVVRGLASADYQTVRCKIVCWTAGGAYSPSPPRRGGGGGGGGGGVRPGSAPPPPPPSLKEGGVCFLASARGDRPPARQRGTQPDRRQSRRYDVLRRQPRHRELL